MKILTPNNRIKTWSDILGDADTVDGLHASATATANKLLALDANAKLPASITGDADTVDGKHASNTANNVPVLDASALLPLAQIPDTLTGKSADQVDGYHAGNSSGQVAVNNGTVNTNLNADMVDGKHASELGGMTVTFYTASSTTHHVAPQTYFTDIPDVSCSVPVQPGDTVVAICQMTAWGSQTSTSGYQYRMAIGSSTGQILDKGYWREGIVLMHSLTVETSGTLSVRPQFQAISGWSSSESQNEFLLVLRFR